MTVHRKQRKKFGLDDSGHFNEVFFFLSILLVLLVYPVYFHWKLKTEKVFRRKSIKTLSKFNKMNIYRVRQPFSAVLFGLCLQSRFPLDPWGENHEKTIGRNFGRWNAHGDTYTNFMRKPNSANIASWMHRKCFRKNFRSGRNDLIP